MDVKQILDKGMNFLMNVGGLTSTINIISYTFIDEDYDDTSTKIATGSFAVSGLTFTLNDYKGSEEAMLLEQGKIKTNDRVLYCGSISTSGNLLFNIGNEYYTIINDGINSLNLGNDVIYSKFYLRLALGGSLF